jgi:CHAT domain-containing protein
LLGPIRAQLGGAQEIIFVPDHELYEVPYDALWDNLAGRYLVEQYVIRFAPSARSVTTEIHEPLSPAAVVADPRAMNQLPLPATRAEATRIASLHHAALLTQELATKARFLELARTSALLHFAGHANSDATQAYGALLLASGDGDSGILSSVEIERLSLRAQPLVVLAACGTFRGNAAHVSGMSSLARSFLIAGARSVVGTLWEIDDDVSAPLFTQFHEYLHTGTLPARALRKAQLQAIRSTDERVSHPASWAPIELLRDG